jgi:hypothetical protein
MKMFLFGLSAAWLLDFYYFDAGRIDPTFSEAVPVAAESFWACYVETDGKHLRCAPMDKVLNQWQATEETVAIEEL